MFRRRWKGNWPGGSGFRASPRPLARGRPRRPGCPCRYLNRGGPASWAVSSRAAGGGFGGGAVATRPPEVSVGLPSEGSPGAAGTAWGDRMRVPGRNAALPASLRGPPPRSRAGGLPCPSPGRLPSVGPLPTRGTAPTPGQAAGPSAQAHVQRVPRWRAPHRPGQG